MSSTIEHLRNNFYSSPVWVGIGYCMLVWLHCLWGIDPTLELLGYLGTDTLDTLSLRWAFWHSEAHFAPTGWNALQVAPNILDHLLFGPFINLPFPLADNLWWGCNLWLSLIAGHRLGKSIAPENPWAGWVAGCSLLCGDSLLREINWGHAPQAMWWAPLLAVHYTLDWKNSPTDKALTLSGIWLGISGWCYFFFVPFVLLTTLPLWWKHPVKLLQSLLVATILLAPNLYLLLNYSFEMTETPTPPLIDGLSLSEIHSATLRNWWTGLPNDISNLYSMVWLITIAIGGGYAFYKQRDHFVLGAWSIALGGLLIAGEHAPLFPALRELPIFSRLLWPERFGILIVIGGMVWGVQFRHAQWLIPLMFLETHFRSANVPLHSESMSPWMCLESLSETNTTILELPLKDADQLYNQQSLRQRIHRQPLLNPIILPPFIKPPEQWEKRKSQTFLQAIDGDIPLQAIHIKQLQSIGVGVVLVDSVTLDKTAQKSMQQHLLSELGPPLDLGCAQVWPLSDTIQIPINQTPSAPFVEISVDSNQMPWNANQR